MTGYANTMLPADIQTCAEGSMDWRRSYASSMVGSYGSIFLFCGRRTDQIKALYHTGDGYVLLYKRLSNEAFQWPRSAQELRQLDARSFRWLMEGLKIDQPKAIQKCKAKDLY